MTSVSVLEVNTWPACSSSRLSRAWFSMMPLWTTASVREQSACGWALASEGWPWVAQRV